MTATEKKPRGAYDDLARERIRLALDRYKRAHGIGDPLLLKRIASANGLTDQEFRLIPLSTLQRFLKKTHAPRSDYFLRYCETFIVTQAPEETYVRLGGALAEFFATTPWDDVVVSSFLAPPPAWLQGRFRCFLRGTWHPGKPAAEADLGIDLFSPFEVPYADLTFSGVPAAPYLKATEYVVNGRRDPRWQEADNFGLSSRPNAGVLAVGHKATCYLIVLRGYEFSHPRIYFLTEEHVPDDLPALIGFCAALFDEAQPGSLFPTFEVRLVRVAEKAK